MILDAHHHLWRFNKTDYGWMDDTMEVLKRDYLPSDLEKEISKAGVSGTVVVQARQMLEETRWLLGLAGQVPFIKGVVGWVDLRSSRLDRQLEEFAGHPKLVGVRHVIHDEPDDDFMLSHAFVKGMEKLQAYRLTYDLLLFPKHLGRAVQLVAMFPGQRFVLDHISKPCIRKGMIQPWKDDMEALAAHPNVWCKISGMVTEARPDQWKTEDFIPYMEAIVNAFGTGRIMLGSDWPVCRLAATYHEVLKIPVGYLGYLPAGERMKVFYQNAIDFYQLKMD